MSIQTILRDGQPEYVVLPWDEYQALLQKIEDARDAALLDAFDRKLASREKETVPSAVVDALLAGANPIKVWREHRGLTQESLAERAHISNAYLSQLESGKRQGALSTLRSIATALDIALDDLC